jgi:hypothetical protein
MPKYLGPCLGGNVFLRQRLVIAIAELAFQIALSGNQATRRYWPRNAHARIAVAYMGFELIGLRVVNESAPILFARKCQL